MSSPTETLTQAVQATHRQIAALAAAQVALEDVRRAPDGADSVMRAARAYRQIEADLKLLIDEEVNAHIALMNSELEGGENADGILA